MLYKSGVVSNGPIPHIVWQVGIRLEKIEVSVRRTNRIRYDGKVYCLEVPTGIYITRRNGKVAILGNSSRSQIAATIGKFEDLQQTYKGFWEKIFAFVLDMADLLGNVSGLEPEKDFEDDTFWKVVAKFPPIMVGKETDITAANKQAIEDGYMSPQTAATRLGLSFENEHELILEFAKLVGITNVTAPENSEGSEGKEGEKEGKGEEEKTADIKEPVEIEDEEE